MIKITGFKQKKILYALEESYPNGVDIGYLKSHIEEKDEFLEFDLNSLKGESFIKERGSGATKFIFLTEKGMEHTRKLREKEYREKQNQILENQTKFNKYLVIIYFVIAFFTLTNMIENKEIKYLLLRIGIVFLLSIPFIHFTPLIIDKIMINIKKKKRRKKLLKSF